MLARCRSLFRLGRKAIGGASRYCAGWSRAGSAITGWMRAGSPSARQSRRFGGSVAWTARVDGRHDGLPVQPAAELVVVVFLLAAGLSFLVTACSGAPVWAAAEEAPATATGTNGQSAPDGDSPVVRTGPITGSRDLLERHGVDASQFNRLRDGLPVGEDDLETMLNVLFWVRGFAKADVLRWARHDWRIEQLVADPASHRGEMFLLQARAEKVTRVAPPPEDAERLELDQYYLVELKLGPQQQPALILAERVPQAWLKAEALDEPASAEGVFMKLAGEQPERPMPVFVAARVAWHPDTPLGNLGVDVGLLDDVAEKRPFQSSDREPFYQVLSAVGRTAPGQLLRQAEALLAKAAPPEARTDRRGNKYFAVAPLFNEGYKHRGKLYVLQGTARRVQRILVTDTDIQQRYQIDHYYQIEVYTDDSAGYPLTFVVRELPEGMPTSDGAARYGEAVRIAGFFLKNWAFQVPALDDRGQLRSDNPTQTQIAPLLIGRDVLWLPAPQPERRLWLEVALGTVFFVVVLGLLAGMWWSSRSRPMRGTQLPDALPPIPAEEPAAPESQ